MNLHQQYQQTLQYLFRQLPMFQRQGAAAMKKDLGNIRELCRYLEQPQQQFKSIHLAGTNGKGSTAHLLSAALQAAGYKVGLYTSPHYKDFRERIKINGRLLPKRYIIEWVAQHKAFFEPLQASFFEITVAMAFDYFATSKVDVAIIETGLGGRLDSTNIIRPELSIITNISYDHQQFLGDTLPLIAGEKAGIIKREVPVVIGETHPETKPVFLAKAGLESAPIVFADAHLRVEERKDLPIDADQSAYRVDYDGIPLFEQLTVQLRGHYQQKNIATALQALMRLKEQAAFWQITWQAVATGWSDLQTRTRFMGRWQRIGKRPDIICDSAHNEGGLRQIFQQLRDMEYQQLHLVIGVVNDKTLEKILPLFPTEARYYFAKADIPRGLPAATLQQQASQHGLHGRSYSSVRNALRAAKRKANPDDLIFVGGSIFVVAEVL
ncbi:MAG: folylpolyglutamate synthase/dihydrofolate synthase family protein [Bacteroidota bacterium]